MSSEEIRVYYIVEKILDTRINRGEREYLILWKGFSREEATWESAKHCECPEAIAAFHRKRRAARFSESPTWKKPYPLRKKAKTSRRCMRLTRSTTVSKGYDDKNDLDEVDAIMAEEKTDAKSNQVQEGKKIAALLNARREGGELVYTVLYQGKGPRKERIDSVPSSVLRKDANEDFLDCLEEYALANCENRVFV
ncbi:unnamed protein product [Cylicocyclus nassatus]|uniref:Chromo domain-containing protein n=1 Tax=Cylicocyclus nassatus TaxID=53992 RepID=A0AA36H006_CYLNA|nr:unnamed protein product [Cylicocyclus nassatus]